MSLEKLYSDPSLIGIPPRSPLWSSDEKLCAFLWNENGERAKNLYCFSPQSDFKLEKLTSFEDQDISEFCWGRGNHEILFIRGTSIYIIDTKVKRFREIIKSKKRKRSMSLSPDQKYLSFIQDQNLWILNFKKKSEDSLTNFDPIHEGITNYRWSPDSKKIAYYYHDFEDVRKVKIPVFEREYVDVREVIRPFPGDPINERKVGIVEVPDGKSKWIGLSFDSLRSFSWSPSGKKLLMEASSEYANKRNIYIASIPDMEVESVYQEEDGLNTTSWIWSSEWIDEGQVALTSDKDGYNHLYSLQLENGEVKQITSGRWEIFRIYPAAPAKAKSNSKELYFIANKSRPENRALFKVNSNSGDVERIANRDGVYRPFISPSGKNICVLFSDDMTPFDLYYVQDSKLQRISSSPQPEFYDYLWAKTEYLNIESKKDTSNIRVKILYPTGFDPEKKYPAIIGSVYANAVLNQWGGRSAHPTWGLDQYLVQAEKYILMNVDIRGSSGYGRKFRAEMLKGYGVVDIEDLASAALYLKSLPYIQKERIGIWGSSYGGLLTLMSLFKKPGIFACGIAGAPATNVFHAFPGEMEIMKSAQNKEAYEKSSAYQWSQGLNAPVMIIHGIKDMVVLFMDSVSLVEKMIKEGKEVEFVVLPEAAHAWDMGSSYQTVFAFKKMVSFFSEHLKKN